MSSRTKRRHRKQRRQPQPAATEKVSLDLLAPDDDDAPFDVPCPECGTEHVFKTFEAFSDAKPTPCSKCGHDYVTDVQERMMAMVVAAQRHPEVLQMLARGDTDGASRFIEERYGD